MCRLLNETWRGDVGKSAARHDELALQAEPGRHEPACFQCGARLDTTRVAAEIAAEGARLWLNNEDDGRLDERTRSRRDLVVCFRRTGDQGDD